MEALVAEVALAGGCMLSKVDVIEAFPATVNDPRRTDVVLAAAAAVAAAAPASSGAASDAPGQVRGLAVEEMKAPFPWSEDFGYFGAAHPKEGAVLFGLGSGADCPPLHSKTYDFPDELIPIGVQLWSKIATTALA